MFQKFTIAAIFTLATVLIACDTSKVYDKYQDLPGAIWHVDTLPHFVFNIENANLAYDIEYNLRHSMGYPFRNLYVTYYLEDSTGQVLMSDLQEINLFDSKTGKPLGSGMGDLFDLNVPGLKAYRFPSAGEYHFRIKQFMRRDELPFIISVGITVRKVEEEK